MKRFFLLFTLVMTMGMIAEAQELVPLDRSSLDEPPTGYINGLFTVNEGGTQVYFSQGNLQYVGGEWRFADHQWDILGDNGQGSASEDASRDLFGWGTSGRAHGAVSYQPWSTSQTDSEYYAYGDKGYDLVDEDGTADWGTNGIANGGNVEGLWRVLTREEWEYLFFERETVSGIRYAKAKVNGVKGVLVLPDDWSEEYRALNNTNTPGGRYRDNIVTLSEWESTMEPHGAVFLPAGGYRFETKVWHAGERGSYYSATSSGSYHAWNMSFDDTNLYSGTSVTRRGNGMSVRLVSTSTSLWYTSVTTGEVTEITPNSATASGAVLTEGGTILTAVGVCWSESPAPTIEGEHTDEGVLTGDFTSALTGLEQNTTYYVRAYATDGEGDTMYGDEVEFTTLPQPWDITATANPTDGGTIEGAGTYNEGEDCTLTAIPADCYAFVNWTEDGTEIATTAEITFEVMGERTLVANFELVRPLGTINGKFSVNAVGDQVYFSKGNLQYIGSADTAYWKFADHQWDYLGDNGQGSDSQTVDRDLFGWGTSGYNHGAVCYQPRSTSQTNSDYHAYGNESYNLNDETGKADWGYNAISNGGNTENQWFTLSHEEWKYVFNTRITTSGIRYAMAKVNEVNGVIILPDDWEASYYTLSNTNTYDASFSTNTISETEWVTLEQHGAVFLPAAGYRNGISVREVGIVGCYWSASSYGSNNARLVYFYDSYFGTGNGSSRRAGRSERLVRSLQDSSFDISATANPTEGGSVSGGANYDFGASCTLTATPAEGYTFVNWTEGENVVSTNAEYTFRVTGSRTLVAHFELDRPQGTINGKFSVNAAGDQVYFSKGNLQYIGSATTPYWKFAEHQWDYLGTTTNQNSQNQNVDRDLFGWGTSGYDHGAVCYQPWSTSTTDSDYYAYGNESYSLNDQTGQADWGYNAISNGGNTENQWFTLSQPEWDYVFNTRTTTSGIRYAKATVNEVNGVILLPDDWETSYYTLSNTNSGNASFSTNTISETEWATLEQHGAVFLPVAGGRLGTSVYNVGGYGYYWSASCDNSSLAWYVNFNDSYLNTDVSSGRSYGRAVRLVLSPQNCSFGISATASPTEDGEVSGAGTYDFGASCTLTAIPADGYTFVNWTEGDKVVSTNAEYTFRVTGIRTLVAHFELDRPQGTINGKFSVNADGDQVYFSQGNLQYQASTNTWQFAEHQWDYVGGANANASANSSGWMDLFGWGTSGYEHGAVCYQPWSTSTINNYYYAYGSGRYNLFDQTGKADWGYNAISNGGNKENDGWRTLTQEEWDYLFNTRNPNGTRYAKANVNGVNGVILLPDDWRGDYYSLSDPNTSSANYNVNTISLVDWAILELYGAVFLPAAGCRVETLVNNSGSHGHYWSASSNATYAYVVHFVEDNLNIPNNYYKAAGRSVRLVRSIYSFTISASANPLEGGEVSGAGTYDSGESCTLTATPAEGYTFVNWTEGVDDTGAPRVVSTNAEYTFRVTSSRTLVANFELIPIPEGALNGKFSVNADGDQVYFSQGNLQYIGSAATPYWKFAEHQWDYLGDNGQGSDSQTVDRDLFGWGTSGYNHGAVCYQPWSTSESNSDYYVYNNRYSELYSSTGQADWGYNAISNGGNQENSGWRTLTRNEWAYIFDGRNTASGKRFAMGNVNGVDGLILLPDNWDASTYPLNKTNDDYGGFYANTISATDWTTVLEANGAVFLPKTVGREGTTITNNCNYWSSTHSTGDAAYSVYLGSGYFGFGNSVDDRSAGNVVRLVRSIQ